MKAELPGKIEIQSVSEKIMDVMLFRLSGISDFINRFIDIKLKDRVNWLKLLALIILTARGGTLTPSELSRLMLRSNNSMTNFFDSLVKDGLIKRYRGGKDRRNVQLKITAGGLDYIRQICDDVKFEEQEIQSILNQEDMRELNDLLRTIRLGMLEQLIGKE